ncbi:MAG: hypothetical protein ACKOQ7_06470 [Actinomycetota bacterium]
MNTLTVISYAALVLAVAGLTWLAESTRTIRIQGDSIVVRTWFGERIIPADRISRATVRTDALGGEVLVIGLEGRRTSIAIPLGGRSFDDSTKSAAEILLARAASRGALVDPGLFAA